MPDSETLDTRRRKRVIEFLISGFYSANYAIAFGKTVMRSIKSRILSKELKIQASIAAPDSIIAVTDKWIGPTVLKLTFLDIEDQNAAVFISDTVKRLAKSHNVVVERHETKEKPQPQTITLEQIPRSTKLYNVG